MVLDVPNAARCFPAHQQKTVVGCGCLEEFAPGFNWVAGPSKLGKGIGQSRLSTNGSPQIQGMFWLRAKGNSSTIMGRVNKIEAVGINSGCRKNIPRKLRMFFQRQMGDSHHEGQFLRFRCRKENTLKVFFRKHPHSGQKEPGGD